MQELSYKKKILIVDDSETNREILVEILKDEYDVLEAEGGKKAVEIMQTKAGEISLVLLDVLMPEFDGYDVLKSMDRLGIISDVPVIMISAESSPGFITKAYDLGAVDYVNRPFETTVVQRRVRNTIALYAKQRRLLDIVADQIYEKERNSNMMISILSHIVEFRNGESGAHTIHINIITELLLRQLMKKSKKYNITLSDISLISTASSLHDIGKIAIPDEILNKPGRLTPKEFEVMKTHSEVGAAMLKNLSEYQNEPLLKTSYEICRWHHERYDGKGYPDGLVGDEIPISAQIVSIADVYDALTSERCYKKAYSHEKAIDMICGGECGAFNPLLIECLIEISGSLERELKANSPGINNRREMRKVTDEMLSTDLNELSASGQMLRQIELERVRAELLEKELPVISFTFQKNPSVLTLSESGAKRLGISRIISEPLNNKELMQILGRSMSCINDGISGASPSNPDVNIYSDIYIGGKLTDCYIRCKTLWTNSEKPAYIGISGLIFLNKLAEQ